jgi:NAD-dependent SIR2 family protein deacetylase
MYHSIAESSKQAIDDVVSGHKAMEAYNGILQAIMQLRSLCNHGTFDYMVRKSGVMDLPDPEEALAALQQTDDAICAICSCDVTSVNNPEGSNPGRFTACSHLLCNGCFFQYEEDLKMNRNGESSYCPICRELISGGDEELSPSTKGRGQSYMINPNLINTGQATKLSKLLEDVRGVRHSAKRLV